MKAFWGALLAIAVPIALIAPFIGAHQLVLSWTDFFSNFFNSIWNTIAGLLHISQPSPQQQFASRLTQLQNNESNIKQFYLANAGKYAKQYNISVNVSWAVQVTDYNASNNKTIGELTVIWNGTSDTLQAENGIVSAPNIMTFAVRMNHSTFMSLSQDVINENIAGGIADFGIAQATKGISYRLVS